MINNKKIRVYVIGAPIGDHIGDFSYAALNVLNNLKFLFSESQSGIIKKLRKLKFVSERVETVSIPMEKGEMSKYFCRIDKLVKTKTDFGIIADSGIPGFCDPGHEIIGYCYEKYLDKIEVIPVGLSSALDAALCLSGENMQNFIFSGFFPNLIKVSENYLYAPEPLIYLMTGDKVNSFLKYIYDNIDDVRKYIILKDIRKKGKQRIIINNKLAKYDFAKKDDIIAVVFKDEARHFF